MVRRWGAVLRGRRFKDVGVLSVCPSRVVDEETTAFFFGETICDPEHHERFSQASLAGLENKSEALLADRLPRVCSSRSPLWQITSFLSFLNINEVVIGCLRPEAE